VIQQLHEDTEKGKRAVVG